MHVAEYDTVIIGGGISGFAAAIYAGRFQMKTAILTGTKGGTIILTKDIANYPGFKNISGLDLAKRIEEHAEEYGIEVVEDKAIKVTRCSEGCHVVYSKERKFHTKSIIFATGTIWKKLGIPGEEEFSSKGVHYCALCDGPLYQGKIVGVVGGSDAAAKEAILLADYAKKVYIFVREDKLHPEPINKSKVEANDKIEVITGIQVKEIKGDTFVNRVILDRKYNGSEEFKLDALFIDIGHIPLSEIGAEIGVKINEKKEIMVNKESATSIPGIYAAGDVTDSNFKQAITGVAEGVTAAYSAYHFINEKERVCYCSDDELDKNQ